MDATSMDGNPALMGYIYSPFWITEPVSSNLLAISNAIIHIQYQGILFQHKSDPSKKLFMIFQIFWLQIDFYHHCAVSFIFPNTSSHEMNILNEDSSFQGHTLVIMNVACKGTTLSSLIHYGLIALTSVAWTSLLQSCRNWIEEMLFL